MPHMQVYNNCIGNTSPSDRNLIEQGRKGCTSALHYHTAARQPPPPNPYQQPLITAEQVLVEHVRKPTHPHPPLIAGHARDNWVRGGPLKKQITFVINFKL
ncbi:hypothetical protein J6590_029968 [Homalodisca vitripennis]|nr:hypothetical protein J6590_029968 [Homalodisca vitripennis]